MKNKGNLILFVGFLLSLLLISCDKEPTACIDIMPSNQVTVFDEVTFASCGQDAFWYDWEVEHYQNGAQYFYHSNQETFTYVYDDAGTFDVYLTVSSEKMKKQTSESTQIVVKDVCYTCSSASNVAGTNICYSNYESKKEFEAVRTNFETSGFTCIIIQE